MTKNNTTDNNKSKLKIPAPQNSNPPKPSIDKSKIMRRDSADDLNKINRDSKSKK